MASAALAPIRPGLRLGPYPEQTAPRAVGLDRAVEALSGAMSRRWEARRGRLRAFVAAVEEHSVGLSEMSSEVLGGRADDVRSLLMRRGLIEELLPPCFALLREVARRTLGTPHYDVQLMGGWVIARGLLAEMATGEGKTLTATLPAAAAAMAGIPVHVISANDYLVERDAREMQPLYDALGLRVGAVTEAIQDPMARREAYAADITHVTGKVVAFDYLRDTLVRRGYRGPLSLRANRLHGGAAAADGLLLRGLCFGIVDEADHILVDEARTPLLLARPRSSSVERGTYRRALQLARSLEQGQDFELHPRPRRVELCDSGRDRLADRGESIGGVWAQSRHREEWVTRALTALHVFQRDRHYLVADDRIAIIDQPTGRRAADRSWELGLHQLIELKERCPLTPEQETLARISVQQFYRGYLKLGGMTGTAREVAGELWSIYGLNTVPIPTRRPVQRRKLPTRVFVSEERKWAAVVDRVQTLREAGRPVLVGTPCVQSSEALSALLTERGLTHRVLNARQDADEAGVIAEAGRAGRITLATAMAGRGTDIGVDPDALQRGGLHVIVTQRGEASRIDRQLFGRCARQGDPGSYEMVLSLDDEPVERFLSRGVRRWVTRLARTDGCLSSPTGEILTILAQKAEEAGWARTRLRLSELEQWLQEAMAFSGR